MIYLILVSFVWAFSFSLIKTYLTGLDSNFVSFLRLFVSFLVFAPFLKISSIPGSLKIRLMLTGMVQYGLMYLLYIYSFKFLKAYEVALFTIFTPFFVTLVNDLCEKKFHKYFMINVIIAILGTFIIVFFKVGDSPFLFGFFLVQLSNLCFAFGQIYYKRILADSGGVKDFEVFGLMFAGAALISAFPALLTFQPSFLQLNLIQILILIYLGAVASGLCFFFWNLGGRKVNAGTLAIFNNLKIPLAVLASVVIFGETVSILKLSIGLALIVSAIILNEWISKKKKS